MAIPHFFKESVCLAFYMSEDSFNASTTTPTIVVALAIAVFK